MVLWAAIESFTVIGFGALALLGGLILLSVAIESSSTLWGVKRVGANPWAGVSSSVPLLLLPHTLPVGAAGLGGDLRGML